MPNSFANWGPDLLKKPTATSATPSNRRTKLRIDLGEPGRITIIGQTGAINCVVLDISETGAKLEFPNADLAPSAFKLYIDRFDFVGECIVVWRSATTVGVIFEVPPLF